MRAIVLPPGDPAPAARAGCGGGCGGSESEAKQGVHTCTLRGKG